jgi:hypothetical protein
MPRRSCSIPGLPCVWDVHASSGLCRSLLPLDFDLETSADMVGARRKARASRAHPTSSWHWSRIGMGLLCAQKPHLAHSDRKRASGCSHATSKHRAASAGLLATAGEPASCMFLMPCIRDARVPQAAAGCVWNAASAGTFVRHHGDRCDLSEVAAPNGVRLQPVGDGTSVGGRGSTGESHVARVFKFAPPMCSVRSRTGHGHALRLVRLARTASARFGYVGSIMGAPSCAIDHHRTKPSPEPILRRATERL